MTHTRFSLSLTGLLLLSGAVCAESSPNVWHRAERADILSQRRGKDGAGPWRLDAESRRWKLSWVVSDASTKRR